MSRFYASISGSAKSEATRQGTKNTGIEGHVRGWDLGVKIYGDVDKDDKDGFHIYMSSGSGGGEKDVFIGSVHQTKEGNEFRPA